MMTAIKPILVGFAGQQYPVQIKQPNSLNIEGYSFEVTVYPSHKGGGLKYQITIPRDFFGHNHTIMISRQGSEVLEDRKRVSTGMRRGIITSADRPAVSEAYYVLTPGTYKVVIRRETNPLKTFILSLPTLSGEVSQPHVEEVDLLQTKLAEYFYGEWKSLRAASQTQNFCRSYTRAGLTKEVNCKNMTFADLPDEVQTPFNQQANAIRIFLGENVTERGRDCAGLAEALYVYHESHFRAANQQVVAAPQQRGRKTQPPVLTKGFKELRESDKVHWMQKAQKLSEFLTRLDLSATRASL